MNQRENRAVRILGRRISKATTVESMNTSGLAQDAYALRRLTGRRHPRERALIVGRVLRREAGGASEAALLRDIAKLSFHEALRLIRERQSLNEPGASDRSRAKVKWYRQVESGSVVPPGGIIKGLVQKYFHVSEEVIEVLLHKATDARAAKRAASRRGTG